MLLDQIFPGWNLKLNKVGKDSDDLSDFISNIISKECNNLIEKRKNGLLIKKEFFEKNHFIIKNVLPDYIHHYGVSYFGNKNLNKLSNLKVNNFSHINKNFIVYRDNENYYLYVKPLVKKFLTYSPLSDLGLIDLLDGTTTKFKPFPRMKIFMKNLNTF